MFAASCSLKNEEGVVWVPRVMKCASVSKRVQRGDESVLLTDRMSFCVSDNTPAQRIDGKLWKLETEPRDTPQTIAYRRISVHESAVAVWVCKNQWEKDGKGNETNLGVFGHLSTKVRYVSSSASWVRITSEPNGMIELPSGHCLLLV